MNELNTKTKMLVGTVGTLATTALAVAPVFAADGDGTISSITSSLTTAMTGYANDLMTALGSIAPIGLPIVGGIAVIVLGIKIFKKVTKG